MADIDELAEKKLKSRMTKIRKLTDGITIFTSPEGKVLFAEYYYQIPEDEEYTSVDITEKQLKSIIEFFEDYKLQLDDSD